MKTDYTVGTHAHKIRKFKANKKHHNLPHKELCKLYKVCSYTITNKFYPAIGRRSRLEVERERRLKIIADPLFGEEGQRAPCDNPTLARRYDISPTAIQKIRSLHGILPSESRWDKPCRRDDPEGKWIGFNEKDKAAYSLCHLTNNWKRPKGIDAHLEALK